MHTSRARGVPLAASLRQAIATCDGVAAAVARDAGPDELAQAVAAASAMAVVLLDPGFQAVALADSTPPGGLAGWRAAAGRAPALLRTVAEERRPVRITRPAAARPGDWLVTPIIVAGGLLGYLLVVDDSGPAGEDLDLVAASYLARMFGLALSQDRTERHLGRRYRAAILNALVGGDFEDRDDARGKARALGEAGHGRFRIAVARLTPASGGTGPADPAVTQEVLGRLMDGVAFPSVLRGTELVLLLPEPAADPPGAAARPVAGRRDPDDPFAALRAEHAGRVRITVGVSEGSGRPEHAPHALRQAQHAADLGTRLGRPGRTTRYEDLGIFRLLLRVGDLGHMRAYAEDVLGELLAYDALHKPDLIRTLSIYLDQNSSPKQTARVLRVHANTVSYRIQRIESLTSLDLADPDDRLSAHVAVKIVESMRADGESAGPSH
ncbi:PucR family transcriptional regulator [Dactylosporangium sp. CA-092794]|uniref:PucR family transcriptional regulator n=1 Tax=Dactylosporangium sp. CA-092794 TaxID=3239929 RepID=UPI003D947E88